MADPECLETDEDPISKDLSAILKDLDNATETKSGCDDIKDSSLDKVATKLLKYNFILTALEFHTELVESGRELPRLRDYFSNPGNFEKHIQETEISPVLRMLMYYKYISWLLQRSIVNHLLSPSTTASPLYLFRFNFTFH